jgi:hypothetical protein
VEQEDHESAAVRDWMAMEAAMFATSERQKLFTASKDSTARQKALSEAVEQLKLPWPVCEDRPVPVSTDKPDREELSPVFIDETSDPMVRSELNTASFIFPSRPFVRARYRHFYCERGLARDRWPICRSPHV